MFSPSKRQVREKTWLHDIHRRLGKRMLTDSLPAISTQPSMRQVVVGIYSNQSATDLVIGSLLMTTCPLFVRSAVMISCLHHQWATMSWHRTGRRFTGTLTFRPLLYSRLLTSLFFSHRYSTSSSTASSDLQDSHHEGPLSGSLINLVSIGSAHLPNLDRSSYPGSPLPLEAVVFLRMHSPSERRQYWVT